MAEEIRETIITKMAPTKMADVPPDASVPPTITAEQARQGRIILRTRLERTIFLVSLFAPAVLLVILVIADALRGTPASP